MKLLILYMNALHTHLKALVLMLIIVFGITVLNGVDATNRVEGEEQAAASIFNPIATFLGIQTSSSNNTTSQTGTNTYDPDAAFENIPDDPFSINLNTPAPITETNTDLLNSLAASAGGSTSSGGTSLANRTPTLLCLPDVLGDSEETIIMWACRDGAYTTTSSGFETGGELIGTTRVSPTADTTYSIECVNDSADVDNTSASCAIEVAEPAIGFITSKESVSRNSTVTLTWKTKDTNNCLLTSDQHSTFKREGKGGEAVSPSLTAGTTFRLTCEIVTGALERREVTIDVS